MHKFLAERGADPSVRHEAGRAYLYQGDVLEMVGNAAPAEQAYNSAIAQLTALSENGSREKQAQRDLARAYNNLGVLLKKANRFQDAEAALRRALSMREQLERHISDFRAWFTPKIQNPGGFQM